VDGCILTELCAEVLLKERLEYPTTAPETARSASALSPEEQDVIVDRLRDLRYIGYSRYWHMTAAGGARDIASCPWQARNLNCSCRVTGETVG
jgi:hypothetical protein